MLLVLDTNHLRELRENSKAGRILQSRIMEMDATVITCVVVAEEALSGWMAIIRRFRPGLEQLDGYERLSDCLETLEKLTVLPFDYDSALIFHDLVKSKIRVGSMDLKIAAICLAHDVTLLSRNLVDFEKVPGLKVENWLD